MDRPDQFTAFAGPRLVATGDLETIAAALVDAGASDRTLIFDDADGRPVELDLRHGVAEAVNEYRARTSTTEEGPAPRPSRGRPRLGVVAREVTLLPRHWDWLATQPGGASAALRRLVEDARRADDRPHQIRQARERAYRVMSALAGDLPGFEEASRALFAGDLDRTAGIAASWPQDIRAYVLRLAAA